MVKFKNCITLLLIVLLPLTIFLFTSNLTLRLSDVYVYHFNDSEVLDEIPFEISKNDMAKGITSYLNSFSSDKFQVYEDNGIFQDPIFSLEDRKVMEATKHYITYGLALALLLFALTILLYVWALKNNLKKLLRRRFTIGIVLTIIAMVANGICAYNQWFRSWLNFKLIGFELGQESILQIILGGNYFTTYVLFSSIIGLIFIGAVSYLTYMLTKPPRIFY